MALTIKRTAGARSVTLQLQGDLDLATAPELSAALDSIPASYGRLVLDLSKLGFIDSTGVRALVRGKQELTDHGVKVDLFDVPRQAAKVLQLLGLDGLEPRGA
jgi:anti-sigma B factor antagonist